MLLTVFCDQYGSYINSPAAVAAYVAACNNPSITRVLWLVRWNDVEPSAGVYNFAPIVGPFIANLPAGKQITVSINPGVNTPAWLTNSTSSGGLGCSYVPIQTWRNLNGPVSTYNIPNPLDPIYQERWENIQSQYCAYLTAAGLLSQITNVRLEPSGSVADATTVLSYSSGVTPVIRYDAQWAALGYTPNGFQAWWLAQAAFLQSLYPAAVLSCSFLSSNKAFPFVDNNGNVLTNTNSSKNDLQFVQALVAQSPGVLAMMNEAIEPTPIDPNWVAWVEAGALPYGQTQQFGSSIGGTITNPPSVTFYTNVLQNCVNNGITDLEVHQANVNTPSLQPVLAQFANAVNFSVSLTETTVMTAIVSFLASVLTAGTTIIRAQQNRTTLPVGPNWVELTPILRVRLSTNEDTWLETTTATQIASATEMRADIQCDVYGPLAGDNAQIIATSFRSDYAVQQMLNSGFSVTPLYTSEARNLQFVNDQNQYEYRWSIDLSVQITPVVTLPQTFAGTATATLKAIP